MRLVIFDIDGTLTQTTKADEECFVRSLADVCGFSDVDTDWSRYKHATDSGILHEIYEAHIGRSPSPDEISQFRQHFVDLLAQASSEAPFAAVAGAPLLIFALGWQCGAPGGTCYRSMARLCSPQDGKRWSVLRRLSGSIER